MMPNRLGRDGERRQDKDKWKRRAIIQLTAIATSILLLCCGLVALIVRLLLRLFPVGLSSFLSY